MTRLRLILGGLVITLLAILPILAQQGAKNGEWRAYGGDEGSTRYSPLAEITRDNIKDMRVAWVWKSDSLTPNAQATSETTPIMVNGRIYFSMDQKRFIVAADAATGETIWTYRPDEGARFDGAPRKIHRGVSYWTDGQRRRTHSLRDSRIPPHRVECQNRRRPSPVSARTESST